MFHHVFVTIVILSLVEPFETYVPLRGSFKKKSLNYVIHLKKCLNFYYYFYYYYSLSVTLTVWMWC